jgi:LysR family transcriptional regulator, nitrogen assimilation regulatory protein
LNLTRRSNAANEAIISRRRYGSKDVNLRQLHSFAMVAESSSFSKAAIRLGTNQPALSRTVRELEDSLGVQLFYRDGRGVKLTEGGRRLLSHAQSILDAVKMAEADISSARSTCVVAIAPTLARYMSHAIVSSVAEAAPNTTIRLVEAFSEHIMEWLQNGRVDVAVVYANHGLPGHPREIIGKESIYLVGAELTVWPDGVVPFNALADLPLVLPGHPHGVRKLVESLARERGFALRSFIEADGLGSIVDLIRKRFGYGLLPIEPLHAEIATGQLSAVKIYDPEITREIEILTARNKALPLESTQIVAAIRTCFRSMQ